MKTRKNWGISILILFLSILTGYAQITQPKVKPRINTLVSLPTTFDKIMHDFDNGIYYEIALVSLQLNTQNSKHYCSPLPSTEPLV